MTNTSTFSDFDLKPAILNTLNTIGYEQPSPIQGRAIPSLLNGADVLGMAQTGTGKTAAFALPILNNIDTAVRSPQALVLTPTRELAIQVAEAFQTYAAGLPGFHVLPIYGGQSMGVQLKQLQRGAQVIVGTPGRVMDHLRRKTLDLSRLKFVVLDEGDEMLRMGFIDDVEWILEHTPKTRQTALFSATMPRAIQRVAETYLKNPETIEIKSATTTVSNIEQSCWLVKGVNKLDALTRLLEIEPFDGVIVFVRTKTATVELADKLEARGYATAALNGDMNQTLRERTVERIKSGSLDVLVATDVAARGIDVARISHVINYDIPYDAEAYVHRIGRTGRAGRSGKAILFVAPRERRMLATIEKATRQPITLIQLPSREQITHHRTEQFKQKILETLETEDLDFFESFVMEIAKEQQISPDDIAKALAFMAQQNNPILIPAGKERPPVDEPSSSGDRLRHQEKRTRGKSTPSSDGLQSYRIEVGKSHEVTPREIVGAIANEIALDAQYIGHIKIYDSFSTVELPVEIPKEQFNHLKNVRVRQQKLDISVDRGTKSERKSAGAGKGPKGDKPSRSKKDDGPKATKSRKPKPF